MQIIVEDVLQNESDRNADERHPCSYAEGFLYYALPGWCWREIGRRSVCHSLLPSNEIEREVLTRI